MHNGCPGDEDSVRSGDRPVALVRVQIPDIGTYRLTDGQSVAGTAVSAVIESAFDLRDVARNKIGASPKPVGGQHHGPGYHLFAAPVGRRQASGHDLRTIVLHCGQPHGGDERDPGSPGGFVEKVLVKRAPGSIRDRMAPVAGVTGILEIRDEFERDIDLVGHPRHQIRRHRCQSSGHHGVGGALGFGPDVAEEPFRRVIDTGVVLPSASPGRHHRRTHGRVGAEPESLSGLNDHDLQTPLGSRQSRSHTCGTGAGNQDIEHWLVHDRSRSSRGTPSPINCRARAVGSSNGGPPTGCTSTAEQPLITASTPTRCPLVTRSTTTLFQ